MAPGALRRTVGALLVVGAGASAQSAAAALYRGCTSKHHGVAGSTLPNLVVIGVQKAGTSSLRQVLIKSSDVCWNRSGGEVHFFDDPSFRNHSVDALALRRYAGEWARCAPGKVRGEKSPSYYLLPRTALRACEALHAPALAVILREPAARALSSFFHTMVMSRQWAGANLKVPDSAHGFDQVARLDVEIATKCGGVPTAQMLDGVPSARERAVFQTCCARVASAHGHPHWPGCVCDEQSRACMPFGDKRAMPVRMGVYAAYLRQWYTRHPASSLAVLDFADVVTNMAGTARALVRLAQTPARARRAGAHAHRPPSAQSSHGVHANSKAHGREMLNHTAHLLRAFYAPFNAQLFELIGRRMRGWDGRRH